jgi:hypothetical protein
MGVAFVIKIAGWGCVMDGRDEKEATWFINICTSCPVKAMANEADVCWGREEEEEEEEEEERGALCMWVALLTPFEDSL